MLVIFVKEVNTKKFMPFTGTLLLSPGYSQNVSASEEKEAFCPTQDYQ
jgi:hypothetical protein